VAGPGLRRSVYFNDDRGGEATTGWEDVPFGEPECQIVAKARYTPLFDEGGERSHFKRNGMVFMAGVDRRRNNDRPLAKGKLA